MTISQQHFTDLLKTIVDLNRSVLKKQLPTGDSPMYSINVLKKHWQAEFLFDITKSLCYTCYEYKYTAAIVILRVGKNLRAFTRDQIKNGCFPEMVGRLIQWLNKDNIWIEDQVDYVKRLLEADYNVDEIADTGTV